MRSVVVIPARYQSSRFPGKPLAMILGKPMIQWVYENAKKAKGIEQVIVATDDQRIYEAVSSFGGAVSMTGECSCGTERTYQAIKDKEYDIIVNVQGDEPSIHPEEIEMLLYPFENPETNMVTLKRLIEDQDKARDPNTVKVVTKTNDEAIYFSRSLIPFPRIENTHYYQHIGIYAYRKEFLKSYISLPKSSLEQIESLEQLRALEYGYSIKVLETQYDHIGVDVPEDIEKVELLLRKGKN